MTKRNNPAGVKAAGVAALEIEAVVHGRYSDVKGVEEIRKQDIGTLLELTTACDPRASNCTRST